MPAKKCLPIYTGYVSLAPTTNGNGILHHTWEAHWEAHCEAHWKAHSHTAALRFSQWSFEDSSRWPWRLPWVSLSPPRNSARPRLICIRQLEESCLQSSAILTFGTPKWRHPVILEHAATLEKYVQTFIDTVDVLMQFFEAIPQKIGERSMP